MSLIDLTNIAKNKNKNEEMYELINILNELVEISGFEQLKVIFYDEGCEADKKYFIIINILKNSDKVLLYGDFEKCFKTEEETIEELKRLIKTYFQKTKEIFRRCLKVIDINFERIKNENNR